MSLCKSEKPLQRVAVPDWHRRLANTCTVVKNQTSAATGSRNDGRRLRHEVEISSDWKIHDNNDKLLNQ